MNIYLGADFARRDEIRGYADRLMATGKHTVCSEWLWTELNDSDYRAHWFEEACKDRANIDSADLCFFFTSPVGTKSRGGRHWEAGYALGRGKQCSIVGPEESQFYTLYGSQLDNFDECLLLLGIDPKSTR